MIMYQHARTVESRAAARAERDDPCRTNSRTGETGSGRRPSGIAMIAVVVTVIGAIAWASPPALGHGSDEEATTVALVEQALAIVVNSPDAVGEALERVEAALAEEDEEPTGELDIASLELAAAALKTGDLHDAEDALVAALGIDPHADADKPAETVEELPSESSADATAEGTADPDVAADRDQTSRTEESDDEERSTETAPGSTDEASHGLTDRVDGGFRAPSGTGVAALALAGLLAVGGFALAHQRTGGK